MARTQAQCDRLKAFGFYRCDKSLYLQIRKHGARSYLFRYMRHGLSHWVGLGPTDLVTLAEAQKATLEYRVMLLHGLDPLTVKRTGQRKGVPTFAECCAQYIADHGETWRNPKHAAQWASTLKTYAAPVIGHLPVCEVTADHVAAALRPIWRDKSETATRLRGRIERVLHWAEAKGHRAGANPAAIETLRHLLPPATNKKAVKHHEALPWAEIPDLCRELVGRDSTSARALLLTILAAARTGETIGAVWPEIDGELWTIPAARMKSKRIHRIPLAPAVVEILVNLRRISGGEPHANLYVFPGAKPGKPLSNMAMLELLRGMRGMGATVHGLRSSFRDWCADTSAAPREVCETALAHSVAQSKTEEAYLRTDYLEARRDLMAAWAAHCMGVVQPKMLRLSLAGRKRDHKRVI